MLDITTNLCYIVIVINKVTTKTIHKVQPTAKGRVAHEIRRTTWKQSK